LPIRRAGRTSSAQAPDTFPRAPATQVVSTIPSVRHAHHGLPGFWEVWQASKDDNETRRIPGVANRFDHQHWAAAGALPALYGSAELRGDARENAL